MSVFRSKTITWDGVEYSFTPSLNMLRRIESRGINLLQCANGFLTGNMQIAMAADCVWRFLQEAMGKDAPSGEDVYGWMVYASGQDRDAYDKVVWEIVSTILPDVNLGKKPEAPESKTMEAMAPAGK
jgi:hypothetical protein